MQGQTGGDGTHIPAPTARTGTSCERWMRCMGCGGSAAQQPNAAGGGIRDDYLITDVFVRAKSWKRFAAR
jgi:hypothetical protein